MVGIKAPAKEVSRDRVLSDDEIRWFWIACDTAGQPWGTLGKVLLLTGQRLGEVVSMTNGEIEGDTWRLSADRGELVEIPRCTFHDLRRTAATGMARLGIPVVDIEVVLNHVSGARAGVAGIYGRHSYEDEKRRALTAWALYISNLVDGNDSKVVRIGRTT